jgi:acyl transferase domain-containing protein
METLTPTEEAQTLPLRVFALSAADQAGTARLAVLYEKHFKERARPSWEDEYLRDLSYTLSQRRSRLAWTSTFLARSLNDLKAIETKISPPTRISSDLGTGYVFTGQGAQVARMGMELLHFPVFKRTLMRAGNELECLGCRWLLLGKSSRPKQLLSG